MKKLMILQTVVPDYRVPIFSFLRQKLGKQFVLYSGCQYFENSVRTGQNIPFLNTAKNHYFFGRRFLFQRCMWREALSSDLLVMELNPRILSNWILLALRKLSSKKSVLWGHAWPRSGKGSHRDHLRGIMRNMADELIVYTESERSELRQKMKDKRISFAPNALYSQKQMKPLSVEPTQIKNIIYVGRMTLAKKPGLLIEAFASVQNELPSATGLIMVGEGPLEADLRRRAEEQNLSSRIRFTGHISDYSELRKLYSTSLFSVSPGYAGLSLTQSFGFGVPALISKFEKHSPEIVAASEGFNAEFFDSDKPDDLSRKILEFFENREQWTRCRGEISRRCGASYSIESMAEPFLNLSRE